MWLTMRMPNGQTWGVCAPQKAAKWPLCTESRGPDSYKTKGEDKTIVLSWGDPGAQHGKASVEKSGFHTRMWRKGKGMLGSQDPGIAPYTGLERECEAKRVGRVLNPNFSLLEAWTPPVFTKVRWFGYRTRLVTKGCFPMGPFTDGERSAAGPYGLETPRSGEGAWCPGVNSAVSCCKNQTNPAALQLCVLNHGCFLRPVLAPSRHGASLSRAVLALCPESQKPRGR